MRIAAAGVMPRRLEASVVKAVVLSGVGGLREFDLRAVTSLTTPGLLVPASAAFASASSQNLSVAWCASNEPSGCSNFAKTSQNGFGTWARRSSSRSTTRPRRRALDAADGEEVGAEAAGGERDGASQRRAPDQVDVLARGAGVGELVGEVVELGERALDLVLRERRVAGALDGRALVDRGRRRSSGLPRSPAGAPRGRSARPRGRSRWRSRPSRLPWRACAPP